MSIYDHGMPSQWGRRTKPWKAEEYIYVDGWRYVYTVEGNQRIRVRFPGGCSATVKELISAGHDVVPPRDVRTVNAA